MQLQNSHVNKECMNMIYRVLMKGITWARDSHGLFDYESRHLTKRTMKTVHPTSIVRKTNELELVATENYAVLDEAAN